MDDFACAPGLLCAGPASLAACHAYCESDADCLAESLCIIGLPPPAGGTQPAGKLCTPLCDPPEDAGCRPGAGCTIQREAAGALRYFTYCRPAGSGTQRTLCDDEEDCEGGHACIGGQCAAWCRVSSPDCPAATSCEAFGSPIRIGGTEYGVCQ